MIGITTERKIGKTIIFAKNHKHAEKIYEIFGKEYPHLKDYAKVIDNYIVDFYCPQLRLAIEIDGYQHFYEENIEYDSKRTEYLESQDIYIVRFENTEVNKDFENVRYIINNVCEALEKGIKILPDYR